MREGRGDPELLAEKWLAKRWGRKVGRDVLIAPRLFEVEVTDKALAVAVDGRAANRFI